MAKTGGGARDDAPSLHRTSRLALMRRRPSRPRVRKVEVYRETHTEPARRW